MIEENVNQKRRLKKYRWKKKLFNLISIIVASRNMKVNKLFKKEALIEILKIIVLIENM